MTFSEAFQSALRMQGDISDDEIKRAEFVARLVAVAMLKEAANKCWPRPKVWSSEEQQEMTLAFNRAQERHGWYETMMAVGAVMCKRNAAAVRAIIQQVQEASPAAACPYCSSENAAIRETYFDQCCAGCVARMGHQ